MAARFVLASKTPTLKLALKGLIFALAAIWFRNNGGLVPFILLLFSWIWIYFRPFVNSITFIFTSLAVLVLAIVAPVMPAVDAYVSLGLGFILFLIVGVKNLVFLKKKTSYQIAHFLIFTLIAFIFFEAPHVKYEILVFLSLYLILREFYLFVLETSLENPNLIAAVLAFIFVQLFWALSMLPINPFQGALFSAVTLFTAHDVITASLAGALSMDLIKRSLAILIVLLIFVFIIATRHLA